MTTLSLHFTLRSAKQTDPIYIFKQTCGTQSRTNTIDFSTYARPSYIYCTVRLRLMFHHKSLITYTYRKMAAAHATHIAPTTICSLRAMRLGMHLNRNKKQLQSKVYMPEELIMFNRTTSVRTMINQLYTLYGVGYCPHCAGLNICNRIVNR